MKKEAQAFDCLAVTNVNVVVFKAEAKIGHLLGLAEVALNDQLIIRGLRIVESEYGPYVGYPVDPFWKGEDFRSLVQPISASLRQHIEACVLEKYQEKIAE